MNCIEKSKYELLLELTELRKEFETIKLANKETNVGKINENTTDTINIQIENRPHNIKEIVFEDLFDINEIQQIQDDFSNATGVASIITKPDGTPITKPSNFCFLCNDIIRKTEKGKINCFKSDSVLGRQNLSGPIVQQCLSGGLWDAGSSITIGGIHHIANWLIGQVRDSTQTDENMHNYAKEIGADEEEFMKAFHEVPSMTAERFSLIAKSLFSISRQLSSAAYQNFQNKKTISELKKAELILQEQKNRIENQNEEFSSLNEILNQTNYDLELAKFTAEENENRFRDILDNTKFHLWAFNGTEYTYCNKNWYDYTGQELDTPLTIDLWFSFVHPNDIEKYKSIWLKNWEIKTEYEINFRMKRFDGIYRNFYCYVAPIFDKNGNFKHFQGYNIDVTERTQAEEALKQSEVKFRSILDASPVPLALNDDDKNITYLNSAFVLTFGYTLEDIPTLSEWWNKAYPDPEYQKFVSEKWQKEIETSKMNGTEFSPMEINIRCKDGNFKTVLGSAAHLDGSNKNIHLVILYNITDRKQVEEKLKENEEKLSTLFSSMTEMIVLHELVFNAVGEPVNYRIIDCNSAFSKITGIEKENAIGKLATDVYQTESAPYLKEFCEVGLTGIPFEYTTFFQPMDKHFAISVVSPKKNQFATITTDITAIKQIQEVISSKNKELENYLFIASHDLRSPLVNIQGFSQRLKKHTDSIQDILNENEIDENLNSKISKLTNEAIPKTLNFIYNNVAKMDTLLNGLLQISRTGRLIMVIKQVNMNQLFESIINANKFQISEISAIVTLNNLPDCYGDENLLNQLFSNLIANAIKYADKNRQLVIDITATSNYNRIVYSIKDNGIGIANRHIEKIFDVFFRVDPNAKESGDGLGLSIVKRIADKHKGQVWTKSEEGIGSEFYIELQKNIFSE